MSKFKLKSSHKSHKRSHSRRDELELNFPLVIAIGVGISLAIYILSLPIRKSFIGVLLYERGFTQFLTIVLASIVVATTIVKFIKLTREYRVLHRIWIADHLPLDQPNAHETISFRDRLAHDGSLIATRCSRVLNAYIQTGDRASATEFALDDSSFYLSTSESSYSFPRILVWAIPLLGFIGTVIGISEAVRGFSGFLEQAGDVEQIKEGIGTVTGGLAVAFDTTLLALFLSVVVMIPLVLIERYESRLLLAIDVFINDKLLPRLGSKEKTMSQETIEQAVKGAIDHHFPNPQDLIEPARDYAQQASQALAEGFIAEIAKVQDVSSQIIEQVTEVRQFALKDRQKFMTFFNQQQQNNQEIIDEIKSTVEAIKAKNEAIANNLHGQSQEISRQLEQAANALERKVSSLEKSANKIADLQQLQQSLDRSFQSLEKTAQLEEVLVGVRENLAQLQPLLHKINQPRRITLLESNNGSVHS
ncbi:MAG: MotA/TolQ/ExbB proton channel family protein [Xenococcaceae cyanobacterium]